MVDAQLITLSVMVLAALSVGGIVYVLVMPYLSGERQANKRMADVSTGSTARRGASAAKVAAGTRKKEVQATLRDIEDRQKSKKKVSLRLRIQRAGFNIPVRSYYMASAIMGALIGGAVFITGNPPIVAAVAAFAGGIGLPRWILRFLERRRKDQFLKEFANSVDVIVRGVKSGLPLNDCLKIIAEEAAEPVRSEFIDLVEQQRVGIPVGKALDRMLERMPIEEVNFFTTVVTIQQQAGGNLSEALENLSAVLRDRQRLAGKVRAFSAEAKASASIIGCLPLVVMGAMSILSPSYITVLWTHDLGKMMLLGCAVWMFIGALIMRNMINFDY